MNAGAYGTHYISDTLEGDLNEVLFQGKYVFPKLNAIKQFGNIYLGKAKYYGLVLRQSSVGNICLDVIASSTGRSVVTNEDAADLTANSSVELRENQDLELAISVKYENTTETTTDLKIGVWINGTLQKGGYIYANPGSVSIPKENTPRGYMIVDDEAIIHKSLSGEVVSVYNL